jgi:hypothetical protein
MVRKVQQSDLVLLLYDLNAELNVQCEWGRFRPTLVVGIGNDNAALFQFAILLHDLCGVRPQDRIGEIADHALWPSTPPALLAETDEQVAPSGGCRLTYVDVKGLFRLFRNHAGTQQRIE